LRPRVDRIGLGEMFCRQSIVADRAGQHAQAVRDRTATHRALPREFRTERKHVVVQRRRCGRVVTAPDDVGED
jgi:hypothetical protein